MNDPAAKILIVDDERINVEFFEVMLSRLGYDVATAGDGDSALDIIVADRPDLVLLDNILPGRTGWDITRLIKKDERYADVADTAIVMFSAMDEVEDKVEGFELGIDDYITKPFNFSEVLARIQAVLRQRELSKQVIHRENRLALNEDLSRSFESFASKLKAPLKRVLGNIADGVESLSAVDITGDINEALELVSSLEREIDDTRTEQRRLQEGERSIDDLEATFRRTKAISLTENKG